MKKVFSLLLLVAIIIFSSCKHKIERATTNYNYFDTPKNDTLLAQTLYAITDNEELQFGVNVAYVNTNGDTIIPFGKYAFFGSDSFNYFANVIEHPNDSLFGRQIGINRDQEILFDLVMFDNGPEAFNEGLLRVIRNGKMGYANKYGRITIPSIYEYARWFENGKAEVTFNAIEYIDFDEHKRVESDEWFEIDKSGKPLY